MARSEIKWCILCFCRYILFVCLSDAWVPQDHKLPLEARGTWGPEVLGGCVHPPFTWRNKWSLNKKLTNSNLQLYASHTLYDVWRSEIKTVFFFLINKLTFRRSSKRRVKQKKIQTRPSILHSQQYKNNHIWGLFYWDHLCLWASSV